MAEHNVTNTYLKLVQDAHDLFVRNLAESDIVGSCEFATVQMLLGSQTRDVNLLLAAYKSFMELKSPLGQAMVLCEVFDSGRIEEFAATEIGTQANSTTIHEVNPAVDGIGNPLQTVVAALGTWAANDQKHMCSPHIQPYTFATWVTFCRLCHPLLTAPQGLSKDPFLALKEEQDGMVAVGDLNITLQKFATVDRLSLLRMPGEEIGADRHMSVTQCEDAVKQVLAAKSLPILQDLLSGFDRALSTLADGKTHATIRFSESLGLRWQLRIKRSPSSTTVGDEPPAHRLWKVCLDKQDAQSIESEVYSDAQRVQELLQSRLQLLNLQLQSTLQGLQVCYQGWHDNNRGNKRTVKERRHFDLKQRGCCDLVCDLCRDAMLHPTLGVQQLVRTTIAEWGDDVRNLICNRILSRSQQVSSEADILGLFELCDIMATADRSSLFSQCLARGNYRVKCRVQIRNHQQIVVPVADQLRKLMTNDDPGAAFDYLMFMHVTNEAMDLHHFALLERTCLQWLWQVTAAPKRLCFPELRGKQFKDSKLPRQQHKWHVHGTQCVYLLCKQSFVEGQGVAPIKQRRLLLILLLLL